MFACCKALPTRVDVSSALMFISFLSASLFWSVTPVNGIIVLSVSPNVIIDIRLGLFGLLMVASESIMLATASSISVLYGSIDEELSTNTITSVWHWVLLFSMVHCWLQLSRFVKTPHDWKFVSHSSYPISTCESPQNMFLGAHA